MMQHIRSACAGDAIRLAEIEVFNYRLNFYPIFQTERYFFSEMNVADVAEEYRCIPERIAHTYVYDDGIVKGFVRISGEEIEKLFVEPAFQNRGIGSALLQYALDNTTGNRLLVLEKNNNAVRLYERHGFRVTGERQRVDDTSEWFLIMQRSDIIHPDQIGF